MPRLYEWSTSAIEGETTTMIDLDKIAMVRTLKEPHHHFPKVTVRFVDGEEVIDMAPPEQVHAFLDAFRAYLDSK